MSTNTQSGIRRSTVHEPTQLPESYDVVDDLGPGEYPHLECPADGTLLEDTHRLEGGVTGTYECPSCREVWKVWEVFQER